MTHAEESNDYPKFAGNMAVLSRDAVSGYKLLCSCEHEFMYIPNGVNSIAYTNHPPHGNSKPTAMCPACKVLWLEDAEFVHRKSVLYFATYVILGNDSSGELELAGIGKAFSRSDAINIASNGLREDAKPFNLFSVKFLTKEEYDSIQRNQQKASALRSVALLAAFTGFDLGEVLKEKSRGRKPRKE